MCDQSNESYWAVLSYGAVYSCLFLFIALYKVALTFESVEEILTRSVTTQMKTTEQYFIVVLYYTIQGGSNVWVCG